MTFWIHFTFYLLHCGQHTSVLSVQQIELITSHHILCVQCVLAYWQYSCVSSYWSYDVLQTNFETREGINVCVYTFIVGSSVNLAWVRGVTGSHSLAVIELLTGHSSQNRTFAGRFITCYYVCLFIASGRETEMVTAFPNCYYSNRSILAAVCIPTVLGVPQWLIKPSANTFPSAALGGSCC